MEEILASIRRIISDDDKPDDAAPEEGAAPEQKSADEPKAESEAEEVAEEASGDDADIFDLTEIVPEKDEQADEDEAKADAEEEDDAAEASDADADSNGLEDFDGDLDFVDPEDDAEEVEVEEIAAEAPEEVVSILAEPEPEEAEVEQPAVAVFATSELLSGDAGAASSSAFKALAETLIARKGSSRTVEDLLGDLLRPMLKSWLDEKLPALAERLVRDEIERIARRGGR